jgi:uncharacterized SAM-binding protein YcdF (DUF218 family)
MVGENNPRRKYGGVLRWVAATGICTLLLVAFLLLWGGRLLDSSDPVPAHVDAAVVLEGSLASQSVRLAAAMELLRQGVPERVLLPIPQLSYWGDPVPPMARRFLETNYGPALTSKVDFCDMSADVNSTFQEVHALGKCIQERGWDRIIVVTSNYHTRRAGLIWRRVMAKDNPKLQIWMHGVADPDFQPDGWWRNRLWAKTWFLESTKLIWTETVDR